MHREDHEQPEAAERWGWRFHHLGIPTDQVMPEESPLPEHGMFVSGFASSPYGIEWMRFSRDSPVDELIKKMPHLAFEVDDMEAALVGKVVITPPNSPSPGVLVAMIVDDGCPIELIQFGPARPKPGDREQTETVLVAMRAKVVQIRTDDPRIIAPCGLNCSLCRAYVRERNPCPGCRGDDTNKSDACLTCAIRNCEKLTGGAQRLCSCYDESPCASLLRLDARYKSKYGLSAIGNLERMCSIGVERFLAEENARWSCEECGSRLCMHKPECLRCGHRR